MKQVVTVMCVLLIACSPRTATPSSPVTLFPYSTITPSSTPEGPEGLVFSVETSIPSSTPFTYTIQVGDTMSEIAEKYHVSLDDLIAANPNVSPNSMSVGQTLLIPSNPSNPGNASTPTPVPASVKQIECYPTIDRGLWCFALVHNDLPDIMENVSAHITLVDSNGAVIASQTALLPLNILPPNTSLPLYAFFAPDIPADAKAQVQLLTAIQIPINDPRYLPAAINNTSVQIDRNGHSAHVNGQVSLPPESNAATQVWVVVVAYDEFSRVVGVKRWEGGGIQPGGSLPFNFAVASVGSKIDRVEFVVEAWP
jgi:LysM repeat protein